MFGGVKAYSQYEWAFLFFALRLACLLEAS
jgi:hypothetical protein